MSAYRQPSGIARARALRAGEQPPQHVDEQFMREDLAQPRHAALVRDDEGGLSVRRFASPEDAAAASAARDDQGVAELDPAQLTFARTLCKLLALEVPVLRLTPTDQVLTLEEAIAYTKTGNMWSFYKWCKEYHVQAITRGRYSRRALDGGLRDECRGSGRRKPAADKPATLGAA
ncbi:hypothetical protein [Nibricoccus sp. IMCC34717]|uniref:hypothetical protein n=1 Tax=Nibricoccus sp. IMCC34717 TaxID=3034021 RepID=UPI00384D5CB4